MNIIIEIINSLNPFSGRQKGYVGEWIREYDQQQFEPSNSCHKFNAFMTIFLSIRIIIVLIFRDYNVSGQRMSVYLGSWAALMGGPPHYFEFITLLWVLQVPISYLTVFKRKKDTFLWIELFAAIYGFIEPKTIGLNHSSLKRYTNEEIGFELV